jgi:hypothetical protein
MMFYGGIMQVLQKVGSVIREVKKTITRSKGWSKARRKHLKDHPTCAACGSKRLLQVHHIIPFHEQPELELEPSNLISLCGLRDCHVDIGHGGNFKHYCLDVREICADALAKKISLRKAAALAKANRKLNDGSLAT